MTDPLDAYEINDHTGPPGLSCPYCPPFYSLVPGWPDTVGDVRKLAADHHAEKHSDIVEAEGVTA